MQQRYIVQALQVSDWQSISIGDMQTNKTVCTFYIETREDYEPQLAMAHIMCKDLNKRESSARQKPETILCAAIWYQQIPLKKVINSVLPVNCDKGLVVTGHRHGQTMWTMCSLTGFRSVENAEDGVGKYTQGFLTSKNRFVDREEAAIIAYNQNQISEPKSTLYSEDLY